MKTKLLPRLAWLVMVPLLALFTGCQSPMLQVKKAHISGETVGAEYHYQLCVRANEDLANVVIEEKIPSEVSFVRADPSPSKQNGNSIMWSYPKMDKGAEQVINIYYSPRSEGDFNVCTAYSAMHRVCAPLMATMPKIEVSKMGPEVIELGSHATWTITVMNKGTGVASNVRIKDTLPESFKARSDVDQMVGDLDPGECRSFEVTATPQEQGVFTNIANVSWDGFKGGVDARADLKVIKTMVEISKTGPKEAYIFSPSLFSSTVRNSGEATLRDLVVTEHIPAGSTVTDAGGGMLSGDKVVWRLASLEPGESKSFDIRITANRPGASTNKVSVDTARGHHEEATFQTNWYAAPGLSTSLVDERDPIQVGETTVFVGALSNTSQFKPITGALVRILVSPELQPMAIAGDIEGVIRGQEVLFSNVNIEPGQTVRIKVQAKGVKSGPGGAVMQVKADFLPKVISNEESTNVVGN